MWIPLKSKRRGANKTNRRMTRWKVSTNPQENTCRSNRKLHNAAIGASRFDTSVDPWAIASRNKLDKF